MHVSLYILHAWVMHISCYRYIHESCTYPLIRSIHLSCTSLWMNNIHSWCISILIMGIELTNTKIGDFTRTWTHWTLCAQLNLDRLHYYVIPIMLQQFILNQTIFFNIFFCRSLSDHLMSFLTCFWPFRCLSDF